MKRALPCEEYETRSKDIERSISAFLGSPQISQSKPRFSLARYLLGEEIAGRGDRLTPYAVGVDALQTGEAFDPSADSRVRVEMKRLRDALAEYNRTIGAEGGVTIEIPLRQYRPRFLVDDYVRQKTALSGWNVPPWPAVAAILIVLTLIVHLAVGLSA